jgi:hypothetical protein
VTHESSASVIMRRAMPPCSMIALARIKNGILSLIYRGHHAGEGVARNF